MGHECITSSLVLESANTERNQEVAATSGLRVVNCGWNDTKPVEPSLFSCRNVLCRFRYNDIVSELTPPPRANSALTLEQVVPHTLIITPCTSTTTTMQRIFYSVFFTFVTLTVVSGQIYGIDYTASRDNPARCATYDEVYNDLLILRNHTSQVRLYNVHECNQGNFTLRAAKALGMKVFLGIQNDPLDVVYWSLYIIQWVDDNYGVADIITGLTVGCESLLRKDLTVETVVQRISLVKNWTISMGYTFPVGTAEYTTAVVNYAKQLGPVCDIILFNIFPIYEGTLIRSATDTSSADHIVQRVKTVQAQYPNTTVMIGETGWSSYNSQSARNGTITLDWYLKQMSCRCFKENIPLFWFEAFDQPSMTDPREANWGIYTNSRQPKFNLTSWDCTNKGYPYLPPTSTYYNAPVSTSAPVVTCHNMYDTLQCRIYNEDPSQVNSTTVGNILNYLCNQNEAYCSQLATGAAYSRCSATQRASWAMDQFWRENHNVQGETACQFDGLGQIVYDNLDDTYACHSMYASLSCRTPSEDPSQSNVTLAGDTLQWICSNFPQNCAGIAPGGQYAGCNVVERLSYAMDRFYSENGPRQGDSACYFDGQGLIIERVPLDTITVAVSNSPAISSLTNVPMSSETSLTSSHLAASSSRTSSSPPRSEASSSSPSRETSEESGTTAAATSVKVNDPQNLGAQGSASYSLPCTILFLFTVLSLVL
ncbi:hypothetical protein PROFUN_05729 [Planoprotostelium fungivorum]|uniref:glucan endo-1,3-beta-D-glucosidase n=1 Tax=Planoprotostelium fungivorum TaxID=1890364 RepID=A0A2P6NQH7_9EUKA|nr:hypothetical protein PROFUN_05729 [Planoprotostelium fungivorum]